MTPGTDQYPGEVSPEITVFLDPSAHDRSTAWSLRRFQ